MIFHSRVIMILVIIMNETMIETIYELIDEIKHTEAYQTLKSKEKAIEASPEAQTLIKQFKNAEKKYHEVKKYSTYHPDYKTSKKVFQEASYHLFRHPLIKAYKTSEKELNQTLEAVALSLAKCISPRLKVDRVTSLTALGGKSCKTDQH